MECTNWSKIRIFVFFGWANFFLSRDWPDMLETVTRSQANKYTQEELMLMKTQDIGYILQKIQSEKKVCCYLLWFML